MQQKASSFFLLNSFSLKNPLSSLLCKVWRRNFYFCKKRSFAFIFLVLQHQSQLLNVQLLKYRTTSLQIEVLWFINAIFLSVLLIVFPFAKAYASHQTPKRDINVNIWISFYCLHYMFLLINFICIYLFLMSFSLFHVTFSVF